MEPLQHDGQHRPSVPGRRHPAQQQRRLARPADRRLTPDDVTPRLVGLGMGVETARDLAAAHPEARIADALDAIEELAARRSVADPVRWVQAAVTERWDVSGLLTKRRANEHRLASLDSERQAREQARDGYPDRRATADRWETAISGALDAQQLARAIDAVTAPVPGIGRRSAAVVRAELVAWAIDVHARQPEQPLHAALAADLEARPAPARPCAWPLPEPPTPDRDRGHPAALTDRLAALIDAAPELAEDLAPVLERGAPGRRVDPAQERHP